MEGNWTYPVTGTIDESHTKSLFDRYRSESDEWLVTDPEVRVHFNSEINTILTSKKTIIKSVKTTASTVLTSPYTPSSWTERACELIKLGHPDLAAFDAFMAIVLCERPDIAVHEQIEAPKREFGRGRRKQQLRTLPTKTLEDQSQDAKLVLATALFFANSFHECNETLENCNDGEKAQRLKDFAQKGLDRERKFHLRNGLSPAEADAELRTGTVRCTVYPWTRKDFLHRTEEIMTPLKQGVERESKSSCAIKRSRTIRNPGTNEGPNDVWGLFSRQDTAAGKSLFKSSTAFVACSQEHRCSACGNDSTTEGIQLPCCSTAKELVQTNLLQKIIASAYQHSQSQGQHPLSYSLIRSLTIARGTNEAVEFSLKKDIIIPMNILVKLGIDIFDTPHFEAWVLQTIQARLRANTWENKEGGIEFLGLSPPFSLFNHSCRPNVEWVFGKDGTTIEIKTLRPIRAGDELYISYLQSWDLVLGRIERKKKLVHWFPECQCLKCKEEEEEEMMRVGAKRIRQPQKKRPRIVMPTVERKPIQLPSPEPEAESESESEEELLAILAIVKVDDENDLDFDNEGVSDAESGYESGTPKLGKKRRRN